MNEVVAISGFCNSSATMSDEIGNGVAPARPSMLVPRVKPYHFWFDAGVMPVPLSMAGSGTLPSGVWPYQILFIALACARFTQSAEVLAPVTPLPAWPGHSTAASLVGS
jgi:hypothetical protein